MYCDYSDFEELFFTR